MKETITKYSSFRIFGVPYNINIFYQKNYLEQDLKL